MEQQQASGAATLSEGQLRAAVRKLASAPDLAQSTAQIVQQQQAADHMAHIEQERERVRDAREVNATYRAQLGARVQQIDSRLGAIQAGLQQLEGGNGNG